MRALTISVIVFVLIIVLVAVWFFRKEKTDFVSGETIVKIGSGEYVVEIANSPALKTKGLSGRDSLEEGTGMLFPFDSPSQTGFWMKGMRFPIDIIWIADGKVISIKENAPVPTGINLPLYKPDAPADYVLEINAGQVSDEDIEIGSKVEIR